MSFLRDDRTEDALVDCVMRIQEEENRALPLLEQQLREAEAGIENMLRAIQLGVLTKSTKTRLEELEAAKERLELEIAEEKIGKPCSRLSLSITAYSASARKKSSRIMRLLFRVW